MANELIIAKVSAIPTAPYTPSTLYFYPNGTELMVYLSDASGTLVYRSVSSGDIGPVVIGVINAIKGSANGLASLNAQSKVIQEALTSSKWSSPITLTLSGDVAGEVAFDGSTNVTLKVIKQPSDRHSPTFTYASGLLSSVFFSNSDETQLTYTQGRLTSVVSTLSALAKTVTKTIRYNQDGTISGIERTIT